MYIFIYKLLRLFSVVKPIPFWDACLLLLPTFPKWKFEHYLRSFILICVGIFFMNLGKCCLEREGGGGQMVSSGKDGIAEMGVSAQRVATNGDILDRSGHGRKDRGCCALFCLPSWHLGPSPPQPSQAWPSLAPPRLFADRTTRANDMEIHPHRMDFE